MTKIIYKIAPQHEWAEAEAKGTYTGSEHDIRDGFIHFSTESQLQGTFEKHFKGQEKLLLIAIDETGITDNLKYEPSRGGELFPHLYGQLPLDAVIWAKPVEQADELITIS